MLTTVKPKARLQSTRGASGIAVSEASGTVAHVENALFFCLGVFHSEGWRSYDGIVDLGNKNTFTSRIPIMNLPITTSGSMEENVFGDLPKPVCFVCGSCKTYVPIFWKNANSGSIRGETASASLC